VCRSCDMIKRNECRIDTLKPRAEYLALYGGDPKEIVITSSYLKFFPAMRPTRQRLVMKAFDELQHSGSRDFNVYRLLCEEAIEVFLKDPGAWHKGIALFAMRNMVSTQTERKHRQAIKECQSELRKVGVSQELTAV